MRLWDKSSFHLFYQLYPAQWLAGFPGRNRSGHCSCISWDRSGHSATHHLPVDTEVCDSLSGGGGGLKLMVGFQPFMVISPTVSCIRWCMQVYGWWFINVDLSCLGRTIYARQFCVPSHRFNSATGEQKGITRTIYTDSEPPSRMPNSLMPNAKLRSANLPFFTSLVWRGRGSNTGLPHPERKL